MTDLDYALKMYGTATLAYAKAVANTGPSLDPWKQNSTEYDNMVFWQNQVWMCAKEQAERE